MSPAEYVHTYAQTHTYINTHVYTHTNIQTHIPGVYSYKCSYCLHTVSPEDESVLVLCAAPWCRAEGDLAVLAVLGGAERVWGESSPGWPCRPESTPGYRKGKNNMPGRFPKGTKPVYHSVADPGGGGGGGGGQGVRTPPFWATM